LVELEFGRAMFSGKVLSTLFPVQLMDHFLDNAVRMV
jgi:hypothetical protein